MVHVISSGPDSVAVHYWVNGLCMNRRNILRTGLATMALTTGLGRAILDLVDDAPPPTDLFFEYLPDFEGVDVTWSSNPAIVMADYLTDGGYDIDIPSFKDAAEYCSELIEDPT